ncbi:MAG: hypothetical protein V7603_256 [Micromonosporaceae bacterium]
MRDLPAGLVTWARMAGPSIVLDAVRQRARRGQATESGVLRVALTGEQRREVARLLGTPWDISGYPVRLQNLGAALDEHGLTVRTFVESLDGRPVVNERQIRANQRAAAAAERAAATAVLAEIGVNPVDAEAWLADPSLPRPGSGDLRLLTEQASQVWCRLPEPGQPRIRLAQLAATVRHNAHALDYREELGRAVSRLIAVTRQLPRPLSAGRDWRRAWAAAGVLCDAVSSRVLIVNLPLRGTAPAARWSCAAPGEPLWLTLRSISGRWSIPAGTTVFVCENPNVLEAAADELGPRCPPLICTDGIPSIAALDLIAALAANGCPIAVRADIDDAGFVVVEQVRSVAPAAKTWRFDAVTYASQLGLPTIALDNERGQLRQLREIYAQHRIPVHEEAVLDQLIGDLAAVAPADC